VPTTLLGRHPGWGAPGGAIVAADVMAGMLEGIEANGLFALLDGVITDYMASPDQVEVAASAIARIKAVRPQALVLVDPVMGDADTGGLYVSEAVAAALAGRLVPLADVLTPNPFELARLTGHTLGATPEACLAAAGMLGCQTLVTSAPCGPGRTGTLWVEPGGLDGLLFAHSRQEAGVPKGTGDFLSACLMARLLEGLDGPGAAAHATATVAETVRLAVRWSAPELPVVGAQEAWHVPALAGLPVRGGERA
jgi:pyridoxine kinase